MRRGLLSGFLALLLVLLVPATGANAAAVALVNGNTLSFAADFAVANDVTVTLTADNQYEFTDPSEPVDNVAGSPTCEQNGPNSVRCPATAAITMLEVRTGDLQDVVRVSAPLPTTIRGGPDDDDLGGGPADDEVNGELGNDTLDGGGGDDEINGEEPPFTDAGSNLLEGGLGRDTLNGGGGPDTMQGGPDGDVLAGRGEADVVDGGDGTDLVSGGDGQDQLNGGAGDDQLGDDHTEVMGLPPERGDDVLDGGPGNDLLRPGAGTTQGIPDRDTLRGGSGRDSATYEQRDARVTVSLDRTANDGFRGERDNVTADVERLVGGQAGDRLTGGPAADAIDGFEGADTIAGGGGKDVLDGGVEDAESDAVSGGTGNDVVRGNAGDDALRGDGGRDLVRAGRGSDGVSGGPGADSMTGDSGADDMSGGGGDDAVNGGGPGPAGSDGGDEVRGGAGDDTLAGAGGDDVVAGGAGLDLMSGGPGTDTVDYTSARRDVTVTLDGKADDGERGERDNVRTDVEAIDGGGVQDTFTGSGVGNRLDGGNGEDFVDGRQGSDKLSGGGSRDVVRARDGKPDTVACGRSTDFAIVDRFDRAQGCERRDLGRGAPVAGREVVVQPAANGAEFGLPGFQRTAPLLDRINVPVSTDLDARGASVKITSASSSNRAGDGDRTASGTFSGGLFSVSQSRVRRPVTTLKLKGGDFGRCRRGARGRASGLTIRRLGVRARGRYRTRGRYSASTVTGTSLTVEDRCDGTLTRVRRGVVLVRDFTRNRTVTVRAGQSYLARAPGR